MSLRVDESWFVDFYFLLSFDINFTQLQVRIFTYLLIFLINQINLFIFCYVSPFLHLGSKNNKYDEERLSETTTTKLKSKKTE
jgi:hypothetical protein